MSPIDSFVQQGGDPPFSRLVQQVRTSLWLLLLIRVHVLKRVIDADYRCLVGVVLFNHSEVDFAVKPGDRVAQMIVQVIVTPEDAEVEDLDTIVWGEGGLGSTSIRTPSLGRYI
ncbi:deoxyuridine 5'-triphosphate nucleotidohydrolase-like [Triticum aestivum]|uniref:dUTP diphosphatase n=1 Tax=Aegilops tauschii TaxID=37682 RepID=N1QWR4_AEGTA|nr:deoxyuridine 5'-triphosphate nucleotidohydrolase-like [Triticum aestivum]